MAHYQVLHILGSAQVDWTGIAGIVAALAKRLDPQRFRFHACFLGEHGPLVSMMGRKGIAVQVLDWHGGMRDLPGMLRFARAVRGGNFAIIHQHFGGRSVRWIGRHAGGARIITHLHSRVDERRWRVPDSCNVEGADMVIATSLSVAKWSGVDAKVVYPGVNPGPEAFESVIRRDRKGHIIGTAGRLVPLKGLEFLVRALPMVRAVVPDVELEIAGTGPEEKALRKEVQDLGLEHCVRFLGWQEEIPFRRWSVFAMPSLEEAFGIAGLEAMAAGLPVVASAVGGLTELIIDGITGWLVPPADPRALSFRIVPLLINDGERRAMGAAARERAGRFTEDRMCERIEGLYNRLLG